MDADAGLFTDSTGEGTPGATDVSLGTWYNGSIVCKGCTSVLNPLQKLNSEYCPSCTRSRAVKLVKGRMA
jgi:hypothetical protein